MLDEVLKEVAIQGRTVVMTSHDFVRVQNLANRFDVLSRGKIVSTVKSAQLSQDGLQAFYRQALEEMSTQSSPSFYKAMMAVVWKDLTAEIRSREVFSAMLVFALLVVLIFNFALELEAGTRASITSGVLWVTFTFAGTLGLNRSMAQEKDRGCMDGSAHGTCRPQCDLYGESNRQPGLHVCCGNRGHSAFSACYTM